MASAFPGSPRVLKGALVVFETPAPVPTNIIAFQFNPDSVTRTFRQQLEQEDPYRSAGDSWFVLPPTESLSMSVELDASDQLEAGDAAAIATGLHPTLAALELLLYPSSIDLIVDKALALAGSARVRPLRVPIVLLVWGPLRVLPVRVESVSITEEAFDPRLNPIRAKISLGLRVLTVADVGFDNRSGTLFLSYLRSREALAQKAPAGSLANLGIGGL